MYRSKVARLLTCPSTYLATPAHCITFLCCLANFINSADRVLMPLTIIQLSDEFHWDLHQNGRILSAFSVGYMGSMIAGGSAAMRFGGNHILWISVLLWSLSCLLTPLAAYSTWWLIFLRFLLGVGEGIGFPAMMYILSHVVPFSERSRAIGYLMAAGSLGQLIATLVCPHLFWRTSFYALGLLGFCWLLLWLFNRPGRYSTPDSQSSTDPLNPEPDSSSAPFNYNVNWWEYLSHWPLWAIYIAHFCMNWSNHIVMQWLPTYLVRYLGAGRHELMSTTLPYLLNSAASVVAGHLADNLVKRQWQLLSIRRLMTGLGLLVPALLLVCFPAFYSIPAAMALISLSMGFSGFNSAGHLVNHVEVAPHHASITFALSNTLATIPGILCGPLTAELVLQSNGRWFPVFLLAALMNLFGGIIYTCQSSTLQVI